jgi:hypothetical protein
LPNVYILFNSGSENIFFNLVYNSSAIDFYYLIISKFYFDKGLAPLLVDYCPFKPDGYSAITFWSFYINFNLCSSCTGGVYLTLLEEESLLFGENNGGLLFGGMSYALPNILNFSFVNEVRNSICLFALTNSFMRSSFFYLNSLISLILGSIFY